MVHSHSVNDKPINNSIQPILNHLQSNGKSILHGNIHSHSKPHLALQPTIKQSINHTLHTTPFDNATTATQSIPTTPKHNLCSKTISHSNHNISKTPSHSNYITSKTHSHSDHSTLIGKQCTSECDLHSKS
eukprot:217332_1